jgi:hypothetical protein
MAESPDEALHATRLTPKDMLRPLWQNHPTKAERVAMLMHEGILQGVSFKIRSFIKPCFADFD